MPDNSKDAAKHMADHLASHREMVGGLKRDSDELHRKMEEHGKAIGSPGDRDWSNPKVYAPR